MNSAAILVVTGASGSGKTAAVRSLEERSLDGLRCFYFDSIGVPSTEEMDREFGGGEAWQADATRRWIKRLVTESDGRTVSVLDGQTRPSFVRAALAGVESTHVRIVLLECSPAVRRARLAQRGQPELATLRMDNWAAYLRGQADALDLRVIDTDALAVESVTDLLAAQVKELHLEALGAAQRIVGAERR
jgi:dephospho-CoA kinase